MLYRDIMKKWLYGVNVPGQAKELADLAIRSAAFRPCDDNDLKLGMLVLAFTGGKQLKMWRDYV